MSTWKEKETVPGWRDGAAGEALQLRMVDVLVKRYFDFELYKQTTPKVFASGAVWAATGRLLVHIDSLLEMEYGPADS